MKNKTGPIGLICFDTKYIIFLFIIIILFFVYYIHTQDKHNNIISQFDNSYSRPRKYKKKCSTKDIDIDNEVTDEYKEVTIPNNKNQIRRITVQNQDSYLVNKDYERVINPLLPPERRNHYIDPHSVVMTTPGVPINIPTRGHTTGAQQVGALYKQESTDGTMKIGDNNEPVILPLFGMPTHNGSNKWTYYTATDKFNQVKLPITNKSKECSLEYGCDELYEGDIITVPAYNGNFKVNKYQFDKPRYIPYL